MLLPIRIVVLEFGLVQLLAFVGAILAVAVVYRFSRTGTLAPLTSLLLTGYAVGSLLAAGLAMTMYLSGTNLRQIFFYLLGGFEGSSWLQLALTTPIILAGTLAILLRTRALNGFLLGEEAAAHLGVDVRRERVILLGLASLITAAAVSIAGPDRLRRAGRAPRRPARRRAEHAACPAALGADRGEPAGRGRPRRPARRGDPRRDRDRGHRRPVLPRPAAPDPLGIRAVRPGPAALDDASQPIVELIGVDAAYRERTVLRGIDVALAPGERVAVIGPNGAGKSSLLRVLAGTLRPTAGRVRLLGEPIERLDRMAIARRLAVVPQVASLPFAARVEEVVGLGRLPHEDPFRGHRPADKAAIAAAIDRVGVGGLLGRDARELSLGERQLVLLALAVAQSAPVLVLDEPTVHLDLRHQVETMELLVDLNERDGTTILAVLHDLGLAGHFFPRLILLDAGEVVADGDPDVVLADDRIRDVFRVDPAFVRRSAGSAVRSSAAGGGRPR